MSQVIVLGGCGAVGSVAVKTLATQPDFSRVQIADIDLTRAEALAAEIGQDKAAATQVDATDAASLRAAIEGCDLVLNCVGPFYKSVRSILETVISAGINYVDVCDDVDVTMQILDWNERVERAGLSALIGMGSSPGVTNILAAFAATALLEETDSIDIFHAHGGEPHEGAGVIGHRFHCMSIDIPMFLEGELKYVKYFEPNGVALRESFTFPVLEEEVLLYPYPHPEQITLPRHFELQRVTNKGAVLPSEYYDLTRDLCALGLADRTPIDVAGRAICPYDFAIAYILRERERILRENEFGQQRGCVSVIAKGRVGGVAQEYRFHLASRSQALGEGTGIPAAMGAMLMQRGKIGRKGVFPPEAGVHPTEFMALLPEVLPKGTGEGSFQGIIVESVDAAGNVKRMEI